MSNPCAQAIPVGRSEDLTARKKAFSNLRAVFAGDLGARLAQVLTISIIGRKLGPAGLGILGTGWALYSVALPLVQNAPEVVGLRELARHPERLRVVWEINRIKLLLAAGAVAALSGFAAVAYRTQHAYALQVAVQSSVLLGVALGVGWVYRGLQRFEIHAGLRAFHAFGTALALYGLIAWFPSTLTLPVIEIVFHGLAALLGIALLRHWASTRGGFRGATHRAVQAGGEGSLRRHGRAVAAQGFAGLAAAASWSLCVPIAGWFLTPERVGMLTVALRLTLVLNGTLLAGLQVFLPILSRLYARDSRRAGEIAAQLVLYAAVAGGIAYAIVSAAAEPLCTLLFGPEFRAGGRVLRLVALSLFPVSIGSAYGYALIAAGRDRLLSAFMVTGALLMAVAALGALSRWPTPEAAAFLPAVFSLQTAAMAISCHARGLVDRSPLVLRWLTPREIRAFIRQR